VQKLDQLMKEFETREEAAEAVAELISSTLAEGIEHNGRASFLTSGGSSPKAMFASLSRKALDWDKVDIGLVDDRCVPADHDASNAKLVYDYLMQVCAAVAKFYPMVRGEKMAGNLVQANENYRALLAGFPAQLTSVGR